MSYERNRLKVARQSKARRDMLRAAGVCICGPLQGDTGITGVTHGPVVPNSGGRCQRCFDLKRTRAVPSSVTCPQCCARPCHPCRSMNGVGVPTRFHQARREAAAQGAQP